MRISVNDIRQRKMHSEKISVVTAYDYSTAKVCDSSGIEIILVGDSAGMVMLGYPNTVSVTMEDMLVFCKGVVNGSKTSMVIADMPFGSYQSDISLAFLNAVKFIKLGCNGIKVEGGKEITPIVKKLSENGIPVMAHIGLMPQTSPMWEGYKVQGKTLESAVSLIDAASELEKAGAFSIVLEMVTVETAEKITQALSIPTIGIGSGNKCDGQVLVLHDLIGLYGDIKPKFAKRYMESFSLISDAIKNYVNEVKSGQFPSFHHSFKMPDDQMDNLREYFSSAKSG
jgi:3-methyl-2-oxobutanoate hydroxymethyltransferase